MCVSVPAVWPEINRNIIHSLWAFNLYNRAYNQFEYNLSVPKRVRRLLSVVPDQVHTFHTLHPLTVPWPTLTQFTLALDKQVAQFNHIVGIYHRVSTIPATASAERELSRAAESLADTLTRIIFHCRNPHRAA